MKNLHLLSPMREQNSIACFFPLEKNRNILKSLGIQYKYFLEPSGDFFEADQIWVDARYFRYFRRAVLKGEKKNEELYSFLEKCKKYSGHVKWLDTTDGTGSPQFDVLPYVDGYLKSSVLKDKSRYIVRKYSRPDFLNFYEEKLGIKDSKVKPQTGHPDKSELDKIQVFWNSSFGQYGLFRRTNRFLSSFLPTSHAFWLGRKTPNANRKLDITCRLGTRYKLETLTYHRLEAIKIFKNEFGVDTGRLKHIPYLLEMRNSKIGPSPFGAGEICYRDYEIFLAGCALLKPDMDYMDTWPNLYLPDRTYIPYKWDFSDLSGKVNWLLENNNWIEIANNGQKQYLKYLISKEGQIEFCERVKNLLN